MRLLALISCLLLVPVSAAYGRTWHVPAEAPTIQAGIDSAVAGDVVEIACGVYSDCTHPVEGPPYGLNPRMVCGILKSGITLRSSAGQAECVTVDAHQLGGVFSAYEANDVVIEGITLTGGSATEVWNGSGGALYCHTSTVSLINCHLENNESPDHGGAIHSAYSNLFIEGCDFLENTAFTSGGGAYCTGSTIQVTETAFCHNTVLHENAYSGGAGLYFDGGTITISGCLFSDNAAHGSGGAGIFCYTGTAGTVQGSMFSDNSASWGGGLRCRNNASIAVANCTFENNTASIWGGAVSCMDNSNPQFENTDFPGNWAPQAPEGMVEPGCEVLLRCCEANPEQWCGVGVVILDNEGCGPIQNEASTWGRVKAMFR